MSSERAAADAAVMPASCQSSARASALVRACTMPAGCDGPKSDGLATGRTPNSVSAQTRMGSQDLDCATASCGLSERTSRASVSKKRSNCEMVTPRVTGTRSTAVEQSAINGIVNGRMVRASCHSHSAATASASACVGRFNAARAGVRSVRPSSVMWNPRPWGAGVVTS